MTIASRLELLKYKSMKERAVIGAKLLEERLASLIKALKEKTKDIAVTYDNVIQSDKEAILAIGKATAQDGVLISRIVEDTPTRFQLEIEKEEIYGFIVAKIPEKTSFTPDFERNIPIMASTNVDNTINKFDKLFSAYLLYADQILVIQKLATEIKRTRRRLVVLEQMVIPELTEQIREINFVLDEREREEQVRLRKFRALKQHH
jgi:V/A-type H+/Na+-transporting ATPase subunit D